VCVRALGPPGYRSKIKVPDHVGKEGDFLPACTKHVKGLVKELSQASADPMPDAQRSGERWRRDSCCREGSVLRGGSLEMRSFRRRLGVAGRRSGVPSGDAFFLMSKEGFEARLKGLEMILIDE